MSIINDFVTYVKQTWENRPSTKSPVSAERLGYMEDGIKSNSDAIEKVAAAVLSTIVNDPDKIASMAALYAVNQTVAANAAAIAELNSDLSHSVKYDELFRYTKAGGYVWLYVSGTISLSANTWHVVGILPDGYRPLSVSYAIIATYGTMDRFGILEVNPDGRVSVFSSQEIGWVASSTVFPVLS